MKRVRVGIEWGPAFDIAQVHKLKTESGEYALIYEAEGGDICIELPCSAKIELATSTDPDFKTQNIICVTIPNS